MRGFICGGIAASLFLVSGLHHSAAGQTIEWLIPVGPATGDAKEAMDSVVFSDGQLYVGGYTSEYAPRVAAYTTDGTMLWSRTMSNPYFAGYSGVTLAPGAAGGVWATGSTHTNVNGSAGPGNQGFVAYFNDAGVQNPTSSFGGTGDDFIERAAGGANGALYTVGHGFGSFVDPADPNHVPEAFVAKHDPSGAVVWARTVKTAGVDVGRAATGDGAGNVFFAGETTGDLAASSTGGRDAFLQKYDSEGTFLWQRQFGTDAYDTVSAVTTDSSGNAYVAGQRQWNGAFNYYVAKYAPDGEQLWLKHSQLDMRKVADLIIGPDDRLFVAGSVLADPESDDYFDAYIAELDPTDDGGGAEIWSTTFDFLPRGQDLVGSITTDGVAIYLAGYNALFNSGGDEYSFLAKIAIPEPAGVGAMLLAAAVVGRLRRW